MEIFYQDRWGTVCDDSWDNTDATVVCRSLGFLSGIGLEELEFGEGSGPIWIDEVGCRGDEDSLAECPSNEWGDHDCGHFEDAGVICGRCNVRSRSADIQVILSRIYWTHPMLPMNKQFL